MSFKSEQEGVIKFCLTFDERPLHLSSSLLTAFNDCRTQLRHADLIGEDPKRYDGAGFGNISVRLHDEAHHFVISGTQTGNLSQLSAQHLACIIGHDIEKNRLQAVGLSRPSSESMTHIALYESGHNIQCVLHVHSADIWKHSDALGLLSTSSDIAYGTVSMAQAVKALAQQHYNDSEPFAFSMRGHQDGVVIAGGDLNGCTRSLLALQQQAQLLTRQTSDPLDKHG